VDHIKGYYVAFNRMRAAKIIPEAGYFLVERKSLGIFVRYARNGSKLLFYPTRLRKGDFLLLEAEITFCASNLHLP